MKPPFRVPITLPLPPSQLLGLGPAPPPAFPFDDVRTVTYYLARNAIWHGADSLGLRPGDEILMPAYHHGVELQTLLAKGMTLRYYRVDRHMRADLEDLGRNLRPQTRALYVIHYLGVPQPIETMRAIASEARIPMLEDCALSLFSRASAGPLGAFGDVGIFCLYKSLPVPHGGVLALNRPDLPLPPPPTLPDSVSSAAYVLNRILDAGMVSRSALARESSDRLRAWARAAKHASGSEVVPIDTEEFDVSMMNVGVRGAARRIIERTDARAVVARRRANYARLEERLDPGVRRAIPALPEGACPLSFPILVPDKVGLERQLSNEGVETINMWSRRHPDVPEGAFPDVEFLRRHVLELPIHQGLRFEHVDYVAERASALARWVPEPR